MLCRNSGDPTWKLERSSWLRQRGFCTEFLPMMWPLFARCSALLTL